MTDPKTSAPISAQSLQMLGVNIHFLKLPDILGYIRHVVDSGKQARIAYFNVQTANLVMKSNWLKNYLNGSQVVFCDGEGIRWGTKLLGLPVPDKVPLTRWVWDLLALCEEKQFRVFLLGGKEGIADRAAEKILQKHPGLEIAGTHHGYFNTFGPENTRVLQKIEKNNTQVLLVCFGMPKQEEWIAENMRRIDVPLFLSGGGVLDYLSERLGQVPGWMCRCGLEWLFRLLQEPVRLLPRYLHDIPNYFLWVMKEKGRRKK